MPTLFLVYFVNLYMFRAYPAPSSEGTTVFIQQLVLIILFSVTVSCPGWIGRFRFVSSLSVYILFTSSSLMVSKFSVCGITFLAGFCSKDFILEMFSVRYLNIFFF